MSNNKISATSSSSAAPQLTPITGEEGTAAVPHMHGLEGLEELGITPEEARKIQAHMATGGQKAQEAKFVVRKTDEEVCFPEDSIKRKATLYFKACSGCKYTVESEVTKIMIEGCTDCTFTINGRVMTQMVEMWNCEGSSVVMDTPIQTFQLDLTDNVRLEYVRPEVFGQLVWAGVYNLDLVVGSGPFAMELKTGVAQIEEKGDVPNFNTRADQFKVRVVKKKLLEELVVRLENGFPTTEREAAAFDERKARDDKKYEEFVRKVIKVKEAERGDDRDKPAAPRNAPCPCNSGKKYKKCCGSAAAAEGAKEPAAEQ